MSNLAKLYTLPQAPPYWYWHVCIHKVDGHKRLTVQLWTKYDHVFEKTIDADLYGTSQSVVLEIANKLREQADGMD